MKKAITILFLLMLQKGFSQTNDKRFIGLDSTFNRVLKDWNCAGFSVAVIEKDKLVYAKGFGFADYENKIPATENTLYASGSCTKAFTCSLLGILQEEGKVDFDKPAQTYLPQLKFYNEELNNKVTIRDMMCHRTGLPRYDDAWGLFKSKSVDSLLKKVQFQEPNYGLREKFQYNNFMFLAQGKIIENLTGKPYRNYLQEKILQPLGMTNLNFSVDSMAKNKDRALGYITTDDDKIKQTEYVNLDVMSSVGGINTSVVEMAKWAMLWANNGVYKGKRILPANYVRDAIGSHMIIAGGVPANNNPSLYFNNYGLGWFVSSYRGHYRVDHGGTITGFTANVAFFPTDNVGIVVFCNQNLSKVTSIVRNVIADRMLDLPTKDWSSYLLTSENAAKLALKNAKKSAVENQKTNEKPSHKLESYEGYYTNEAYGKFEISLKKDSLFAVFAEDKWWLRPYKNDVFEVYQVDKKTGVDTSFSINRIVFNQDINGEIKSTSIQFDPEVAKPIEFERSVKPKTLSKEILIAYTGEFLLNGTLMKISLKNDKTLFMSLPSQPEFELIAIEKDKFNLKVGAAGYSVNFIKDAKGNYNELLLNQPNVTFKATRKK